MILLYFLPVHLTVHLEYTCTGSVLLRAQDMAQGKEKGAIKRCVREKCQIFESITV